LGEWLFNRTTRLTLDLVEKNLSACTKSLELLDLRLEKEKARRIGRAFKEVL